MKDLMAEGANMLDRMRKEHLARTVTYVRGEHEVELAATVGRTEFEVDDGTAVPLAVESRDYIVTAADLVLDGERSRPRRGDRVRDVVAGVLHVYEVMAPGGRDCYRLSGPDQSILRVHTRLIDREGA